jgi:hypothetical protein
MTTEEGDAASDFGVYNFVFRHHFSLLYSDQKDIWIIGVRLGGLGGSGVTVFILVDVNGNMDRVSAACIRVFRGGTILLRNLVLDVVGDMNRVAVRWSGSDMTLVTIVALTTRNRLGGLCRWLLISLWRELRLFWLFGRLRWLRLGLCRRLLVCLLRRLWLGLVFHLWLLRRLRCLLRLGVFGLLWGLRFGLFGLLRGLRLLRRLGLFATRRRGASVHWTHLSSARTGGDWVAARQFGEGTKDVFLDLDRLLALLLFFLGIELEVLAQFEVARHVATLVDQAQESVLIPAVHEITMVAVAGRIAIGQNQTSATSVFECAFGEHVCAPCFNDGNVDDCFIEETRNSLGITRGTAAIIHGGRIGHMAAVVGAVFVHAVPTARKEDFQAKTIDTVFPFLGKVLQSQGGEGGFFVV